MPIPLTRALGPALAVALLMPTPAAQASLTSSSNQVSLSQGGGPTFLLDAGVAHAGKPYVLVGSLSGISPGTTFGSFVVPLNWDAYTSFLDNNFNLLILRSFANLDAMGRGTAQYALPAGIVNPMHAGLVAHHAYVVFGKALNTFDATSNPVPMTFVR